MANAKPEAADVDVVLDNLLTYVKCAFEKHPELKKKFLARLNEPLAPPKDKPPAPKPPRPVNLGQHP